MSENDKLGLIEITFEKLQTVLGLPDNLEIVDVLVDNRERMMNSIIIKLKGDHREFYERIEGQMISVHQLEDLRY